MEQGKICIYVGEGQETTMSVLGKALLAADEGKQVMVIRFMKDRSLKESAFLKRLEPEVRFFRFEKCEEEFGDLPLEHQRDEIQNIKNGLHYARKVLRTGECDLLILDGVLGLLDPGIITEEEMLSILSEKTEEMQVVLTGIRLHDSIDRLADEVCRIDVGRH